MADVVVISSNTPIKDPVSYILKCEDDYRNHSLKDGVMLTGDFGVGCRESMTYRFSEGLDTGRPYVYFAINEDNLDPTRVKEQLEKPLAIAFMSEVMVGQDKWYVFSGLKTASMVSAAVYLLRNGSSYYTDLSKIFWTEFYIWLAGKARRLSRNVLFFTRDQEGHSGCIDGVKGWLNSGKPGGERHGYFLQYVQYLLSVEKGVDKNLWDQRLGYAGGVPYLKAAYDEVNKKLAKGGW